MKRYLNLLSLFARVSVQENTAYRADFLGHVVMSFLQLGAELLGLWTIFSNTQSLAGWNVYQLLALLGVFRFMSGVIGMIIAPNMRQLMEAVREGTLDFILIRPINSQFLTSARRIVMWRITDLILGLGVVIFASAHLTSSIGLGDIFIFVALLLAGTVTIYSFWLVLACLSFWFTKISNIEMVFWNVFEAGRYPVDIYRPWIRRALTYIIPLAFLTTFPASALVGKTNFETVLIALTVATAAFIASSLFWQYGIRRYSGASA